MKYLLFDQEAISILIGTNDFQSIEYALGRELVDHFCGQSQERVYPDLAIKYKTDGVMFIGKKQSTTDTSALKIYCVDLTACDILTEREHPSDLLTIMQKSFRTVTRIWTTQPFSSSEKFNGTKSILFPFTNPDKRRLVIERSNDVKRFSTRGIVFPLLAYKYSAEDPPHREEIVDTKILQMAGEEYRSVYFATQNELANYSTVQAVQVADNHAIHQIVTGRSSVERGEFMYLVPTEQYKLLTESQKKIVFSQVVDSAMRIEGAAGTGKTVSLVLRAYRLLQEKKEQKQPFKVLFVTHSESTKTRCLELFSVYPENSIFLSGEQAQSIVFTTLLEYCREFARIPSAELIDNDADAAKTYQLMLIEEVVSEAEKSGRIKTFRSIVSRELADVFDENMTPRAVLVSMLQHEFAIQIKGRTDCLLEQYIDLKPIPNGLPCKTNIDKQMIFALFSAYQAKLKGLGSYDVDDVTAEALAHLNAPVWRRKRYNDGYDYIIADEMHLFNINEQGIFHYLTRSYQQEKIPLCFALDYSQAIGDRGQDTHLDYVERSFGSHTEKQSLKTVFRNSPQIAEFCAALAASGTLMFQTNFHNPYDGTQSNFNATQERMCDKPTLYMYENEEEMLSALNDLIDDTLKKLQCKKHDIAIISFDSHYCTKNWAADFSLKTGKPITLIQRGEKAQKNTFVLAAPDEINGLEFAGVILLGVDDGRIPQKSGVGDISKHYIMYTSYNLLYLASSRAKYRLMLLGNSVNGVSPCLEYALNGEHLIRIEQRK